MNSKMIFGLLLILIGGGFLLDTFQYITFSDTITMWWPLLIVLFGIAHISKKNPPIFSGLIIIGIGLILQADKLGYIKGDFWDAFWPLILIILGISILLPGRKCPMMKNKNTYQETKGDLNINTMFSGQHKNIDDKNFKGGSISAMFAGIEIDMSNCELSEEGAILNLNVAFGGVEISVPNNWNIKISGTPFLGGFEDDTHQIESIDSSKTLIINYSVMFGGIELNNKTKNKMR